MRKQAVSTQWTWIGMRAGRTRVKYVLMFLPIKEQDPPEWIATSDMYIESLLVVLTYSLCM